MRSFGRAGSISKPVSHATNSRAAVPSSELNLCRTPGSILPLSSRVAFCVLPICPNFALDRLEPEHEATLWRRARQILFALVAL